MGYLQMRPDSPRRLTTSQAAAYIGIRPGTLEIWRAKGRYHIPFVRIGRLVRYDRADLDRWLKSRRECPAPNR